MAAIIKVGDAAVVVEVHDGKLHAHYEGVIPSGVGSTRNDAVENLSEKLIELAKKIKFAQGEVAKLEKAGTGVGISRDEIPTKPF